jgi:hypothetical protein
MPRIEPTDYFILTWENIQTLGAKHFLDFVEENFKHPERIQIRRISLVDVQRFPLA